MITVIHGDDHGDDPIFESRFLPTAATDGGGFGPFCP
jgi:hypothetical protein